MTRRYQVFSSSFARQTRALALATVSCILLNGQIAKAADESFVLDGVTIVDTRDGKLTPNARLTVTNGKISGIAAADGPPPAGAIDAGGKFVVPGFVNMHAHPEETTDRDGSLNLMLAHGITGFRQMSGSPELLEERRKGALQVKDAPTLLALPGTIIIPINAFTPEEATAEVKKQKEQGADFIKLVDATPATFDAIAAETKRSGIPFLGHLPNNVNAATASDSGMKSIEHLGPRDSILVSCSTDAAALRGEIAKTPVKKPPFFVTWIPGFKKMVQKAISNPLLMTPEPEYARYKRIVETFNADKCRQIAAKFVANETWQVPTLIRLRTMEFGDAPEYKNDPNLAYMPAETRKMWDEVAQEFSTKISPASKATLTSFYELQLKLVKLFQDNGVKILAGDDFGGQWVVPGFGLHQEFDEFAKAGLTPLQVLQATTINAAEYLNATSTLGTVEPGKNADLVLLDANPIESVQNLHKISGVVLAGHYYSQADLAAIEDKVKARNAK